MQNAKTEEIKNLLIFLLTVVIITMFVWTIIEIVNAKPGREKSREEQTTSSVNKVDDKKEEAPDEAEESNMAIIEEEPEIENVPLVGENLETYSFRDPFAPLSKALAPKENLPVDTGSDSSDGDSNNNDGSNDNGDSSKETSANTATDVKSSLSVDKIFMDGKDETAIIKIDAKQLEVKEGHIAQGYKIVDIDTIKRTVELLDGDQRVILSL